MKSKIVLLMFSMLFAACSLKSVSASQANTILDDKTRNKIEAPPIIKTREYVFEDFRFPVGTNFRKFSVETRNIYSYNCFSIEECRAVDKNPKFEGVDIHVVFSVKENNVQSTDIVANMRYNAEFQLIACGANDRISLNEKGEFIVIEYWPWRTVDEGKHWIRYESIFNIEGESLVETEKIYAEYSSDIIYEHKHIYLVVEK